ncbi:MAG: UbiA family prenyltransferase [Sphingomonadales bacterium]|nr:UbiA family prenyltransferase [Sphingomonadales bacterium]
MRMTRSVPIVVDLDGTLTPTDTLIEAMVRLVKQSPVNLLHILWWLVLGRARLKAEVARRVRLAPELLPYREPLIDWLRQEKLRGSTIVLATAAEASIAADVAAHLGLFDAVLATDAGHNLKGTAKLAAIRERVGHDFVYAGDSSADLPIWNASAGAILAGVGSRTAGHIAPGVPIAQRFPNERGTLTLWAKALRVHQWMKNFLLFVPLMTAFRFMELEPMFRMTVAFFAFSLAASATYVANDLWDLDSDRAHPRKRNRPFASGRLSIAQGIGAAALAMAGGLALAAAVSPGFLAMLCLYVVMTTVYSWVLKSYVLADALMLSVLYTLRIVAGAVAIAVPVSSWLLAFSLFVFLSLALVKRCSELVTLAQVGALATRGRDYRVSDLSVLWPLGLAAALAAVVVFGLFISAPETRAHYRLPELLWLNSIVLTYWLARLWIKTSRGEMHDDPVVYAVRNAGSRVTVLGIVLIMGLAHVLPAGLIGGGVL